MIFKKKLIQKLKYVFCCFAPFEKECYYEKSLEIRNKPISTKRKFCPSIFLSTRKIFHLIGPKSIQNQNRKTLVLDLDETLVHSTFEIIHDADYIIPVEIDGHLIDVYVQKRPWLDYFISKIKNMYEIVIFTASLKNYANPLIDKIDVNNNFHWRLFRDSCSTYNGTYVKDLSLLGRDISQVIIIDNSSFSYALQPRNAIPIANFFGDKNDRSLYDLIPMLLKLEKSKDVRDDIANILEKDYEHVYTYN